MPCAEKEALRRLLWIGVIVLAAYGFFLARNSSNVAGGADSSGYLNSARLLASGSLAADLRGGGHPVVLAANGPVAGAHLVSYA